MKIQTTQTIFTKAGQTRAKNTEFVKLKASMCYYTYSAIKMDFDVRPGSAVFF